MSDYKGMLELKNLRIWGVERMWKAMKDKNSNNSETLSFLINILVSVITTTVVYFLLSK